MTKHKQEWWKARAEIRRVLLEVWDPIGIRDEPNAQDEYDSYIGHIYRLLARRASEIEISDYLYGVETDQMGLPNHEKDSLLPVVHALKRIAI
jgi:hypothetical protein